MSDHYESTYLGQVLQAISQLGNALCGGRSDVSISARIGQKKCKNWYWRYANWLVDLTFYPVDGPDHCYRAWQKDADESYAAKGGVLMLIPLTVLYTTVCYVLLPITWTVGNLAMYVLQSMGKVNKVKG